MRGAPQTNIDLCALADLFKRRDDFVICGHVNPDGDCIGSQLALAATLRALGKRATCLLADNTPLNSSLSFLPGAQDIVFAADFAGVAHTFVAVDVPTRERMGAAAELCASCEISINIDHHIADKPIFDFVYATPDAASTTMLIWELASLLGVERSKDIALCCYAGLASDTGSFQYQNADAAAFRAAVQMVEAGVVPSAVSQQLFHQRSFSSMRLEGLVLSRIRLGHEGCYALSWVSREDFENLDATVADAEPLVDTLRHIAGIRVACMVREQDECVRVSLRAKDDTDVAALARLFGGGGHKAAAGFTLKLPFNEALKTIEERLAYLCANGHECTHTRA